MRAHPTDRELQQWIDDGAPARGEIGQHLARCRECTQKAQAYARLWQALALGPAVALPEEFAAKVARRAARPVHGVWLRQAAAIVAIAGYAAVGCALLVYVGAHVLLFRAVGSFWLAFAQQVKSFGYLTLKTFSPLASLLPVVGVLLLTIMLFHRLLAQRLRP